jgi:hypothetical protein
MQKDNLPDFTGKMVIFYTRNAPRGIQDGMRITVYTVKVL